MTLYEVSTLLADGVGVIAFGGAFVILLLWRAEIKNPVRFFLVWAAAWLFEYYFLGENSYIHMDDEGDHFIPYYLNIINNHLGGQFGHRFAGGNDIYIGLSPSIQLVSPELFWLEYLPIWVAVLLHKAIVVSVGFWGSYLLCHKTVKVDALTCIAVAALFTVSTHNLVYITYSIGSSLCFLPMAIWIIVARSDERHYWRYSLPFVVVLALYLDPAHVLEATFAGIGLAAFMLRKINPRVMLSLAILLLAELINWAEPIYAMAIMSPLTDRGNFVDSGFHFTSQLQTAFQSVIVRTGENRSIYLAFGSLTVLWLSRDRMVWRWAAGVIGTILLYMFTILFPFHKVGLAALNNLSHHYLLLSITALMLLPLASAAETTLIPKSWNAAKWPNVGSKLILALAIGMLAHFKVYNFSNLLYHGGQSQYQGIATLAATNWRPQEPFRVITLRVRDLGPEPALAYGLYGLESFDVFQMLQSGKRRAYYYDGILKQKSTGGKTDPRILVDWSRWQNGTYRGIGEQVSLNLLRIANVSTIISPIPIEEDAIQYVTGPDRPPMTKFERNSDISGYLKDRIARLFDFPDMYLYSIPDAYPQLYSADRVTYVADKLSDVDFVKRIDAETAGPGRVVVARRKVEEILGQRSFGISVESFSQIKNGYRAQINAPDGGILAVNTVALPFWRATADGKPLSIVAVNQIQMAVRVPPGAKEVLFQYHRPSPQDVLQRVVK